MSDILFVSVGGWLVLALLAATIAAPYLLRTPAPTPGDGGRRTPYLKRMRPHYWLGFAVPLLVVAHSWPAMAGGWIAGVNTTGVYLATAAFLVTIVQVTLGAQLRTARSGRRRLRRAHLFTMITIAALTIGHVLLNSAALRLLLG